MFEILSDESILFSWVEVGKSYDHSKAITVTAKDLKDYLAQQTALTHEKREALKAFNLFIDRYQGMDSVPSVIKSLLGEKGNTIIASLQSIPAVKEGWNSYPNCATNDETGSD